MFIKGRRNPPFSLSFWCAILSENRRGGDRMEKSSKSEYSKTSVESEYDRIYSIKTEWTNPSVSPNWRASSLYTREPLPASSLHKRTACTAPTKGLCRHLVYYLFTIFRYRKLQISPTTAMPIAIRNATW